MEEKLGLQFPKLAVFSNVKKFDKNAKEFSRIENTDLFGLSEFRKLFPSAGIPMNILLQRDRCRESI